LSDVVEVPQSSAIKAITDAIDWAYGHVIDDGFPGIAGAETLANDYRMSGADADSAIDSLISWQVVNAGTAGIVTGLGGLFTLPVAIPANLVSVLYLQLRMVAAIAHLRGHDIRSDRVRGLAIACLVGSSASDVLKDVGVSVGTKMTQQALQRLPSAFLININKAVGFRLFTKAGTTGVINLSKIVPIIGGVLSGAFDAVTTRAIGEAAKMVFVPIIPGPSTEEVEATSADLVTGQEHGSSALKDG